MTEFPLEGAVDEDGRERFTPELRSALARNYVRGAFLYPHCVYRPRDAAARPPS